MLRAEPPPRLGAPATRRRAALLAMSSPLLILLALVALALRSGSARWEALPALLIGSGLLITSIVRRRRRRAEILRSLRQAGRLVQGSVRPPDRLGA
jgi:hypothetical protein